MDYRAVQCDAQGGLKDTVAADGRQPPPQVRECYALARDRQPQAATEAVRDAAEKKYLDGVRGGAGRGRRLTHIERIARTSLSRIVGYQIRLCAMGY